MRIAAEAESSTGAQGRLGARCGDEEKNVHGARRFPS